MKIPALFASFSQKSFKKGLTKFFYGCIMQSVKAKASLGVSAQRRYFTFRNPKTILYMKAKASLMCPSLKVPLSIFNTSTHMKRRINYEHCNRLFWKLGL